MNNGSLPTSRSIIFRKCSTISARRCAASSTARSMILTAGACMINQPHKGQSCSYAGCPSCATKRDFCLGISSLQRTQIESLRVLRSTSLLISISIFWGNKSVSTEPTNIPQRAQRTVSGRSIEPSHSAMMLPNECGPPRIGWADTAPARPSAPSSGGKSPGTRPAARPCRGRPRSPRTMPVAVAPGPSARTAGPSPRCAGPDAVVPHVAHSAQDHTPLMCGDFDFAGHRASGILDRNFHVLANGIRDVRQSFLFRHLLRRQRRQ